MAEKVKIRNSGECLVIAKAPAGKTTSSELRCPPGESTHDAELVAKVLGHGPARRWFAPEGGPLSALEDVPAQAAKPAPASIGPQAQGAKR